MPSRTPLKYLAIATILTFSVLELSVSISLLLKPHEPISLGVHATETQFIEQQPPSNNKTTDPTKSSLRPTPWNITYASRRISWIAKRLEAFRGRRYYVYDHANLTLPHLRAKSKDPTATSTWGKQKWAQRFQPYADGELRFYEALEACQDSNLRTFNITEADFVLVPIPLGTLVFWGSASDVIGAFDHLFREPYFQKHPEKHVYITNNERLLRGDQASLAHFELIGFTKEIVHKISKGILVKDFDARFYQQYLLRLPNGNDWKNYENIEMARPAFGHYWSIGYSHETSDTKYNFTMATFDNWSKKEFNFFYRSPTKGKSKNNSTKYRHALINPDMDEIHKLIQPSAVGHDVRYDRWYREFANSKFCIIIRGDNPSSRSMFVAIRLGCLPVIVSDALPYYQPMFRTLLQYTDFSIQIDEAEFLSSPAETLNKAISSLTEEVLKQKLDGLALLQRILVLDHPSPLFVTAFIHETIALGSGVANAKSFPRTFPVPP